MGFGRTIKTKILEKGMTIKELSEASGVSIKTLYSITQRDSKRIDPDILLKISAVLGVDPYELTPGYISHDTVIKQRVAKREQLKSLLSDLYGDDMVTLVSKASELSKDGQRKLIERADELRIIEDRLEYEANAAKEREYEGE